jgi:cell wall-associated NlpC family hydrolase
MRILRKSHTAAFAAAAGLAVASAAGASPSNWAAPEIKAVTALGVLGSSPATFDAQAALTERALADAISATGRAQTPPPSPASKPQPVAIYSTVPAGVTLAGSVTWQVALPGQAVDHVVFLADGAVADQETRAPYTFRPTAGGLVTTTLADGPHQLAVQFVLQGGATYVAAWTVTVANAPGSVVPPLPAAGVAVPITSSPPPAPVAPPPPPRVLYKASTPSRPVTIKELDAALVAYLDLGDAAHEIQSTLNDAGLHPRPGTGTEAVARMLGLRINHPAGADDLELLPFQAATRAEAAYSFAQVLKLGDWQAQSISAAAQAFTLPALTDWQRRILTTAISYVGYPYVWGGTSPTTEAPFGVTAPGGFDCSGFVWRVYKLTAYAGEGGLAGVLRGRTTYQMSGEVTGAKRIPAGRLEPGDVLFFGVGPRSKPSQVGHMGIYLGNGWFVHSSSEGVTLLPFDGWYRQSFAWARRPLLEAGL